MDELYNDCISQLTILKDWNERVLTGVTTKYGKNSSEYEMVGGVEKWNVKNPKEPLQRRVRSNQ